jgi:hypothetical protein
MNRRSFFTGLFSGAAVAELGDSLSGLKPIYTASQPYCGACHVAMPILSSTTNTKKVLAVCGNRDCPQFRKELEFEALQLVTRDTGALAPLYPGAL